MADARLRSEWLGQMVYEDLSDAAWRIFTSGLMWCVENGTDGEIPKRYLRYLHPDGRLDAANVELVQAGLWTERSETFLFVDWVGKLGQSTNAQVEAYRERNRAKQERHRERARQRQAAQDATPPTSDAQSATHNPVTAPGDVTPSVGKGKGKGYGRGEETQPNPTAETTTSTTEWPVRSPGNPDDWIEAEPGVWKERGAA